MMSTREELNKLFEPTSLGNITYEKDNLNNKSGIYKITNTFNNKFYIGSSVNLYPRLMAHRHKLREGKHENIYLQRSYSKHGEELFEFTILEFVSDKNFLTSIEQNWLDKTKCYVREIGYNIYTNAYSALGRTMSKESKIKLSNSHKGKKMSKEAKDKMRDAKLGKKLSEEHRRKIGEAHKGRKYPKRPKEWCEKLREAHKGKSWNSKLNEGQVVEIKILIKFTDLTLLEISKIYGINDSSISKIKLGKKWGHVILNDTHILTDELKKIYKQSIKERQLPKQHKKHKRLSSKELEEVKELLKSGKFTNVEIGKMYDIHRRTVGNIKKGMEDQT